MDVIKLIPVNPQYIPEKKLQEEAQSLLKSIVPQASEIESIIFEEISFIDPGSNFERVLCMNCESDITEWWHEIFEFAYENNFKNLEIEVPCCKEKSTLNDLNYDWSAGFARFVLQAVDPNIYDLKDDDLRKLESILNCRLKKVRAHY